MTLALKAWVRYVVPLTLLAVVALGPMVYIALITLPPADATAARALLRRGWILASTATLFQLLLVAAAAPLVRSIAAGQPLSQLRAAIAAVRSFVRGILPWLVATCAIVLGGIALVAPGLLVLVLVSMTGASPRLSVPRAAIVDSIEVSRSAFARAALLVAAILIVNLAIAFVAQHVYVPAISKKVAAVRLAPLQTYVRMIVIALVAFAPLAACGLAALYSTHAKRS